MSSKAKQNQEGMKQKSLMSWLGKKPPTNPSTDRTPSTGMTESSKKSPVQDPKTPESRPPDSRLLSSSAMSSGSSRGAFSSRDTPPSSDPDIDMVSSGSDNETSRKAPPKRKRRIVIDDSDNEQPTPSSKKRLSRRRSASPVDGIAKKRRLSTQTTEDNENMDEEPSSLSTKLLRFKKSPMKKKGGSRVSDDDDFVIPSDSEAETRSVKSTSSKASSRRSTASSEEGSGEEMLSDSEHESKKKSKTVKKKSAGRSKSFSKGDAPSFATSNFLTAAERREQGKKDEKKAADDPFSFLVDIRDKDKRRPTDPQYDPRTLFIPREAWATFTPFEKQFWEIKQNHYDTILFFQKGKFLELYEDDARIGHQEFDLKLTSRVKMSMVGVPEMSFNFWAAKFLGKGYKVGRVDQAETALGAEMRIAADKSSGKAQTKEKEKIVRRELNKVYTNGTLVDPELLHDEQAGHCLAVIEHIDEEFPDVRNRFGVCVLDCATSQFDLSAFQDDICRTKLETLMRQIRPKEILFNKGGLSVTTTRILKAVLPSACLWTGLRDVEGLNYEKTIHELKVLYPSEDDSMEDDSVLPAGVPESIRDMGDDRNAIEALGAMIWYLRQLNIDKDILSMKNFNIYDPMKRDQGLVLDGQTLAHLEVLLNNEGTEDGSLLKLLSRCITPFGKRLFRIWLCMPLRDITQINERLDAVEDLIQNSPFETDFTDIAKGLPDLERLVSRIHAKNCRVRDFLQVLSSFKKLSWGLSRLGDQSEAFKSKTVFGLLRTAPDLIPHIKNIENMYQKPDKDSEEIVPREGKDERYDEITSEIRELEEEFEAELIKLQKKVKCKLAYWHSAIGTKEIYLVETPSSMKDVPKDWTKSGSTKAKSRWLVGSLQAKVRQLKEARENQTTALKAFKFRVFAEFDADRALWLKVIRVFAELDCLFSLAKSSAAIGEPSCRPEFVPGDAAWIDFKELRHPTLCLSTRLDSFIPNDVKLGGDCGKIALLTGPNMAGKSTVMRMSATGVIMAQLGMMVPAKHARLCPVDTIITRMGAYDNMFSNASTFKVELDECCKILRDATPKSLVILDELGRGTSTFDGMAIAGAVLHQLATHTLPLSFFATHYGSLTDDFAYHPNIRNMHMSTIVDEEKRDLVFLFKLIEGAATSSFGTHVANLAGVPSDVVQRADVVSKNFAQQFQQRLEAKQKSSVAGRLPLVSQADFSFLFKLGTGEAALPENPARRREILLRLKDAIRHYIPVKA